MSGEGQIGANSAMPVWLGSNVKGLRIAYGVLTTASANDAVATGLRTVIGAFAVLNDDPVAGAQEVTVALSATPGSINVKTWKATATADTALIAATTFGKLVTWFAIGT